MVAENPAYMPKITDEMKYLLLAMVSLGCTPGGKGATQEDIIAEAIRLQKLDELSAS